MLKEFLAQGIRVALAQRRSVFALVRFDQSARRHAKTFKRFHELHRRDVCVFVKREQISLDTLEIFSLFFYERFKSQTFHRHHNLLDVAMHLYYDCIAKSTKEKRLKKIKVVRKRVSREHVTREKLINVVARIPESILAKVPAVYGTDRGAKTDCAVDGFRYAVALKELSNRRGEELKRAAARLELSWGDDPEKVIVALAEYALDNQKK